MNRDDLPELLNYWRTFPAPSNEVAAAVIIEELAQLLRKAESQRDDFRRQLTAEREGRMAAERIVDEVRARNRELLGALDALVDLTQVVGRHPDSTFTGAPLNEPFIKAVAEIRKHVGPSKELMNATVHEVFLPDR